ncbi:MAG: SRPBCC family protein [Gammaproteobacteria bacterium]|nr:SRPBCC family protein [Gammaproteobacteria bacterium]
MKFLKRFILIILILVLVLIGVGYLLPGEAQVERDIRIDAPPEAVFSHVNDLRRFNEWSPWAGRAEDIEYSYGGPDSGVGARMDWQSSSSELGDGSVLITESRGPGRVVMRLDLGARGRPTVYFDIDPANNGSHVVWGFREAFDDNIIDRYIGLIMNYQVGGDFEQGLQSLKANVEADTDVETGTDE